MERVARRDEPFTGIRETLLGLEVRSWKIGFAVLHGTILVESGVYEFPVAADGDTGAIGKLHTVIDLHVPTVAVARSTRHARNESSKRAARLLRKIKGELSDRGIQVTVLPRNQIRNFFTERGCGVKHTMADWIAGQFPELRWKVPGPRKPWHPERYSVAMFDALAAAIVFASSMRGSEVSGS